MSSRQPGGRLLPALGALGQVWQLSLEPLADMSATASTEKKKSGLFGLKSSGSKKNAKASAPAALPVAAPAADVQPTALPAPSAASSSAELQKALADAAAARAERDKLRAQLDQSEEENLALKGQVHLLKFKVDLLVDMVTLANLDCDKLEDELEAATGPAQ